MYKTHILIFEYGSIIFHTRYWIQMYPVNIVRASVYIKGNIL